MCKLVFFAAFGFFLLAILSIYPVLAIQVIKGAMVRIEYSDLPNTDFQLRLFEEPSTGGLTHNRGVILINQSERQYTINTSGYSVVLNPNDAFRWLLSPRSELRSHTTEDGNMTHTISLYNATGILEPKFRITPWELRGTIDGKLFTIKGIIDDDTKPTWWEAHSSLFRRVLTIAGLVAIILGVHYHSRRKSAWIFFLIGIWILIAAFLWHVLTAFY